jgi:hypothetical protein
MYHLSRSLSLLPLFAITPLPERRGPQSQDRNGQLLHVLSHESGPQTLPTEGTAAGPAAGAAATATQQLRSSTHFSRRCSSASTSTRAALAAAARAWSRCCASDASRAAVLAADSCLAVSLARALWADSCSCRPDASLDACRFGKHAGMTHKHAGCQPWRVPTYARYTYAASSVGRAPCRPADSLDACGDGMQAHGCLTGLESLCNQLAGPRGLVTLLCMLPMIQL